MSLIKTEQEGEETMKVLARAEEKLPLQHVDRSIRVEPKATGPIILGDLPKNESVEIKPVKI